QRRASALHHRDVLSAEQHRHLSGRPHGASSRIIRLASSASSTCRTRPISSPAVLPASSLINHCRDTSASWASSAWVSPRRIRNIRTAVPNRGRDLTLVSAREPDMMSSYGDIAAMSTNEDIAAKSAYGDVGAVSLCGDVTLIRAAVRGSASWQAGAVQLRILTEPQPGGAYDGRLAVARATDGPGFDAFFRPDPHLALGSDALLRPAHSLAVATDGPPGPTDAWPTLAGLAREPSRIRLGTLVSSATFRLPGVLAIQVAQVDQMSGGRVELGLGTGWYEQE